MSSCLACDLSALAMTGGRRWAWSSGHTRHREPNTRMAHSGAVPARASHSALHRPERSRRGCRLSLGARWSARGAEGTHPVRPHRDRLDWQCRGRGVLPERHAPCHCRPGQDLRLWDPATGNCARVLTGHAGAVRGVAFSPDGTLLAAVGLSNTARLWDPATGKYLRTLTGHTGSVRGVAFSPDGTILATASQDGTVRLWR